MVILAVRIGMGVSPVLQEVSVIFKDIFEAALYKNVSTPKNVLYQLPAV